MTSISKITQLFSYEFPKKTFLTLFSSDIFLFLGLPILETMTCSILHREFKKYKIPQDILTRSLPDRVWTLFDKFNTIMTYPVLVAQKIVLAIQSKIDFFETRPLLKITSERLLFSIILGPIYEELVFRFLIHKIFLSYLAANALAKFNPELIPLLNGSVVKIIRIVFSASIFALMHTQQWGKGIFTQSGINAQFLGGLTYGILMEKKQSIFYPSLNHIIFNLFSIRGR